MKVREIEDVCYKVKYLTDRRICHYCGVPADTLDHLPPLSRYHDAIALNAGIKAVKIPCCYECNALAGNELHTSFLERQSYIRRKLSTKYANALKQPYWSEEELSELGSALQLEVRKKIKRRKWIEDRMKFTPVDNSDLEE